MNSADKNNAELQGAKMPVLSVRDLSVAFGGKSTTRRCFPKFWEKVEEKAPLVQVTDRVSFDIYSGEFFALVGESGCGKSVTAMSILRLLPYPSAKIVNGEVMFRADSKRSAACCVIPSETKSVIPSETESNILSETNCVIPSETNCVIPSVVEESCFDLSKLPLEDLQKIRGSEIACIFQEPMQALNPVVTIKKQLLEVFKFGASRAATSASRAAADENSAASRGENSAQDPLQIIREQLLSAGFKDPDRVLDSYPHELSGGMLQRVCIVMALLPKPKLIIADEPTTALDVTVQAQVLKVLKDMAEKTGTAVLLITHNMGIVSEYAHRVAVMYAGRIVECGPVREVIKSPMHPYTQGLLAAIPESHSDLRTLCSIPGSVPHPKDFVAGCRFADRCSHCTADCKKETLPPKVAEADHFANCFNVKR